MRIHRYLTEIATHLNTDELRPGLDYRLFDGLASPHYACEARFGASAFRDVYAAAVRLGCRVLKEGSRIEFACLVLLHSSIKQAAATREWKEVVEHVLSPEIGRRLKLLGRMALIGVEKEGIWVYPDTPELRRGAEVIRQVALSPRWARLQEQRGGPPKFFEAFKVLLNAWLRGLGPMPIGRIQKWAGLAYPTTAKALEILQDRGEILRHSNRSVEFSRFPSETWHEVLSRLPGFRRTRTFVDASGRKPDPEFLLERLGRRPWSGLAVGGVVAARKWDPAFDLHGIPRLDLCAHVPGNPSIFEMLSNREPALQEDSASSERVVLAIHPIRRPESLFEAVGPAGGIPHADPVETLLDLHEMRLVKQAEELIEHLLRGRTREHA